MNRASQHVTQQKPWGTFAGRIHNLFVETHLLEAADYLSGWFPNVFALFIDVAPSVCVGTHVGEAVFKILRCTKRWFDDPFSALVDVTAYGPFAPLNDGSRQP